MDDECKLEANGLELITGKSKAEPLGAIDRKSFFSTLGEKFTGRAFAVAWLDYEVFVGVWQEKDFRFHNEIDLEREFKYIQRLRVFDANKELHLWRTNSAWQARLRMDGAGEEIDIVVAHQLLFGTTPKPLNGGFTEISEKRGTKLILPFSNLKVDDERNRVFIKTLNYVKPNAVHQSGYVDCRFVGFTDENRQELS